MTDVVVTDQAFGGVERERAVADAGAALLPHAPGHHGTAGSAVTPHHGQIGARPTSASSSSSRMCVSVRSCVVTRPIAFIATITTNSANWSAR